MKPEIAAQFTDDVLADAAARFELDRVSIEPIDAFENMVYRARRNGHDVILRMSHDSHRKVEQVAAELEWLDYLARHDVSVCMPYRSVNCSLTEVVAVGEGRAIAVVFERAKGRQLPRTEWTREMAVNRGRLIGRMHTLTKSFSPTLRRHIWHEERDFNQYRSILHDGDDVIADKFEALIERLKRIPTDRDSFGLIHMDAHTGNMFFDGDRPTLFDFDDCTYDFFVSDIAISLYYTILMLEDEDERRTVGRQFLMDFLAGYREEHRLDDRWLGLIPMILKRRELVLYVAIHRGFDVNNLDEWGQRFLTRFRPRILSDTPVLELDWTEFKA